MFTFDNLLFLEAMSAQLSGVVVVDRTELKLEVLIKIMNIQEDISPYYKIPRKGKGDKKRQRSEWNRSMKK